MDRRSRIFVAGHRGLVGSAIVRRLKAEGYERLILRTSAELDLRNQAAVDAFFASEKPAYVFLAAAKVGGIYANDHYPADFIRDNLQIQTNVIDAAHRNVVSKLLFLGSSCIYPKMSPQPLKEDYLLNGALEASNEWYAIAKIAGLKMCQAYRRQYGFNAISLMPTNLYGPNDNFDLKNSHVLPALVRKFHLAKLAKAGEVAEIEQDECYYGRIPDDVLGMLGLTRNGGGFASNGQEPQVMLWGTGFPRREFLHVDDLADASLFLMQRYDDEKIVNVGVGEDITIRDLATLIRDIVGFDGEVAWNHSALDGTPRKLLDTSYLKTLGWQAKIGFREGVGQMYMSYMQHAGYRAERPK